MSRATITDNGHPEVILRTTRNPRFVDDFYRTIPRRSRRWSRGGARWFVHRDCLARLVALCGRHFDTVEGP